METVIIACCNTPSVVRNPSEISDSRKVARVVKSPSTSSGSLTNRAARSFERPQRYHNSLLLTTYYAC